MNFAADSSDHSLLIFYIPGDLTDSGHEIQSFAVALGARKKGMMIALPTGLLKDEFVAPGRVVEEDALLGPATTFEVDLILDDEFTGTAYFAGFKGEVVVADFANVLNLLRDYDPVTDSTEEIHSFHEVHHAAIPSAADLLAQAMNWVENEGASRVHFYSAREEPTTKAVSAPKKAAAKRLTNAALAEQLSALQAQVSLIMAQAQGGETMSKQLAEVTAPASATLAGGLASLGTSAVIPKMPPVSQKLQSPGLFALRRKPCSFWVLHLGLGPLQRLLDQLSCNSTSHWIL